MQYVALLQHHQFVHHLAVGHLQGQSVNTPLSKVEGSADAKVFEIPG